jgi:hypothetical protein
VPDPTEGITNIKDRPAPRIVPYDRHHEHTLCPRWSHLAARHPWGHRTRHDLGDLSTGPPIDLLVTSSSHSCSRCHKYCNVALTDLASPGSHDTQRVVQMSVRLVVEDGVPSRPASWHLWRDHRVFVPFATRPNGVEAGGKQGAGTHGWRLSGVGA